MRPLTRKLLPLVGLCWVGMAIAREEIINIPCCEAEDCPIKGTIGSNDPDEVMLVSVKGILSKHGKLVELYGGYPNMEEWYQYLRTLPDEQFRELENADMAMVNVYVRCEAGGDGRGVIDRGRKPVICREFPRARVEQNAPVCSDGEAQGVQLKVEYISKAEWNAREERKRLLLLQEFSELQARKAALDQRAEELEGDMDGTQGNIARLQENINELQGNIDRLQGNIDRRNRELLDHLHGRPGAHNDSGNSSTTETNSYENMPINDSYASWSWRNWLKNLPVTVSDKN